MATAKKKQVSVPAKKKTDNGASITVADIAKELAKTKAYRSSDPYFRDKFDPTGGKGELRGSKKFFVGELFAESNGEMVKGQMIDPEDRRFKAAARLVAGQKWDSMNNYYKATGTKPNRMTDAQNLQAKAERKMRSDGAKPSNRNPKTTPKK